MQDYLIKRVLEEAEYVIDTGDTVRGTARVFSISKSTVHKDLTDRLKKIDAHLYVLVKKVLDKNLSERHIRGGNATRLKYLKIY
ncbi:MAG: sporulation transcriptional regulator SpoIIID [Clostridia bacterium]|nr:sporulation transcriptional regulator SpoIIID [Clostridia bacterium]